MDSVYFVALFVTCVALFFAKWVTKRLSARSAPLPPGPRGLPILGYVPFLGKDMHLTFTNLVDIYGPIYKIWFGNKMCVVLNSPEVVKEVVRDKDAIFADRDSPIATLIATYNGADVAFSKYDPDWIKMRKLFVHELLSKAGLDASYSIRKKELQKAIRQVYNKTGTPVVIGKTLQRTTINAVMAMAWGESTLENNWEGPDVRELLAELLEVFVIGNVSDLFPAIAWMDLQGIAKKMRKVFAQVDQFYDRAIEQKKKTKNDTNNDDMLSRLLELKEEKDVSSPSSSFTMTQLKSLLQDIVLGASDTTATAVEWAMSELLARPKMLHRVHMELNEVVGLNNVVEECHLPKLTYLNAVLKETHRLHPAAPFLIPRKPSETTVVSGYTIPKGSKVLINAYAIHRDPNHWEDPTEFRPDRFMDDSARLDYSGNNLKYIPLGSGRRKCPGLPLSERFGMCLFASFIHNFTWEIQNGVGPDFFKGETGLVFKKANPLVAIPTPRHTNLELYA